MDTLKCGREIYKLRDGDTIMDNGASYQLITRKIMRDFRGRHPRVSKVAFKSFKNNPKVKILEKHSYGPQVTLYQYRGDRL